VEKCHVQAKRCSRNCCLPQTTQLKYKSHNQVGQTGKSWTTRNNFIQTKSNGFQNRTSSSINTHKQSQVEGLLK